MAFAEGSVTDLCTPDPGMRLIAMMMAHNIAEIIVLVHVGVEVVSEDSRFPSSTVVPGRSVRDDPHKLRGAARGLRGGRLRRRIIVLLDNSAAAAADADRVLGHLQCPSEGP